VTKTSPQSPFTLKRVQEMLGLSRTTINGLIAAGFVEPVRGERNELRFSFQDLMLLRTAHSLQQGRIPPRKILRALAKLKADLPAELPLTGIRITAVGADVVVRDRSGRLQAETGQLLMDFEVEQVGGSVAFIASPRERGEPSPNWLARAEALEATDRAGSEDAYRRAIEADPTNPAPYINLGAMLCEAGRCGEAVSLYEQALVAVGDEPLVHFNYAIALEDQQRVDDAITAYGRALALDDSFADAHYNLGVLLEARGDAKGAVRHFNAYRRLQP
jgi:tetratricopeptide (TPR) repeat protein